MYQFKCVFLKNVCMLFSKHHSVVLSIYCNSKDTWNHCHYGSCQCDMTKPVSFSQSLGYTWVSQQCGSSFYASSGFILWLIRPSSVSGGKFSHLQTDLLFVWLILIKPTLSRHHMMSSRHDCVFHQPLYNTLLFTANYNLPHYPLIFACTQKICVCIFAICK